MDSGLRSGSIHDVVMKDYNPILFSNVADRDTGVVDVWVLWAKGPLLCLGVGLCGKRF